MPHLIRDEKLYESGCLKIDWVKKHMPLLNILGQEFAQSGVFKGVKVAMSIHLEAKTAALAKMLFDAGADVYISGSNPLSTQDDVAAGLAHYGLNVFSWYNATDEEYFSHLNMVLDGKPDVVIDDGGDLIHILHDSKRELLPNILGGSEETTTGVLRLRARERENALAFPMIAVNDSQCKFLFDNRYGTGQSVWTGINQTTNLIVAGKNVVVAGYGWCGKGVSMRAKGLGANVIICEVNPIKAVEAVMDGFKVMKMDEAARLGDVFVTVTGCSRVIYEDHYKVMKDGAIMCNAGHFDLEVCLPELEKMAVEHKTVRKNIDGYKTADGRWLYVLAEGRLVNLAAGDGHPAEIMDLSFALQALAAKYILENHKDLKNKVYLLPEEIDMRIASLKLGSMDMSIDTLSKDQAAYLAGWEV